MDKTDFIEKAPIYYAIAIVHAIEKNSWTGTTRTSVMEQFSEYDNENHETYFRMPSKKLFELAVDWLQK